MLPAAETLKNDSLAEQTLIFEVEKGEQHSSHFEHEHGFTIGVGATFSAGLPCVGESEISVSATTEHTWTLGRTTTIRTTYKAQFPVNAPPCSKITAKGVVQKAELEVPYEVVSRGKQSGVEVTSGGTWSGVTTWDLEYEVQQVFDEAQLSDMACWAELSSDPAEVPSDS